MTEEEKDSLHTLLKEQPVGTYFIYGHGVWVKAAGQIWDATLSGRSYTTHAMVAMTLILDKHDKAWSVS